MLMLTQRLTFDEDAPVTATATLPLDTRLKSRVRIQLDDGTEVGVLLARGQLIRGGEVLADATGEVRVRIIAADEPVSTLRCGDPLALARACYHLGNRHVPLQIGEGFARYQHDHVLDDMLKQMGLPVVVEHAPFEPEAGAYHSSGHSHGHHHHGHEEGSGPTDHHEPSHGSG
ncbi:MAG: urease accessory protein UreE [Lautropia sp.]|nr:urease accessory protein UreE [Lautropia sp.]